jgi:uncharacterized protein YndB with AHSA1/START domain
MTSSENPAVVVRVTHRFDATAERVYDAFLDGAQACRFLFATATGQIVRCDIDARVGGAFTITDRRHGADVVHAGTYLALERPRRIVFTFSVEPGSDDASQVTVEIAPQGPGCVVALTHETKAESARDREPLERGWLAILELAATVVVDEPPTCGVGVAQHAAIVTAAGVIFEALAETLALHRQMLAGDDPATRREDEAYRELTERWRRIATHVQDAGQFMAAQRALPMAAHDEQAWGDAHRRAFEKFVTAQSHLLALLRVAVPRDEQMVASMKEPS